MSKKIRKNKGLDDLLFEEILDIENLSLEEKKKEIEKRNEEKGKAIRRRELKKDLKSFPEKYLSPKKKDDNRIIISLEELREIENSSSKKKIDEKEFEEEIDPFGSSKERRKLNSRTSILYSNSWKSKIDEEDLKEILPPSVFENKIDDVLEDKRRKMTKYSRKKREFLMKNTLVSSIEKGKEPMSLDEIDRKTSLPENWVLLKKKVDRLSKALKKSCERKSKKEFKRTGYPELTAPLKKLRPGVWNYKFSFASVEEEEKEKREERRKKKEKKKKEKKKRTLRVVNCLSFLEGIIPLIFEVLPNF